jgi:hypothetical protein
MTCTGGCMEAGATRTFYFSLWTTDSRHVFLFIPDRLHIHADSHNFVQEIEWLRLPVYPSTRTTHPARNNVLWSRERPCCTFKFSISYWYLRRSPSTNAGKASSVHHTDSVWSGTFSHPKLRAPILIPLGAHPFFLDHLLRTPNQIDWYHFLSLRNIEIHGPFIHSKQTNRLRVHSLLRHDRALNSNLSSRHLETILASQPIGPTQFLRYHCGAEVPIQSARNLLRTSNPKAQKLDVEFEATCPKWLYFSNWHFRCRWDGVRSLPKNNEPPEAGNMYLDGDRSMYSMNRCEWVGARHAVFSLPYHCFLLQVY